MNSQSLRSSLKSRRLTTEKNTSSPISAFPCTTLWTRSRTASASLNQWRSTASASTGPTWVSFSAKRTRLFRRSEREPPISRSDYPLKKDSTARRWHQGGRKRHFLKSFNYSLIHLLLHYKFSRKRAPKHKRRMMYSWQKRPVSPLNPKQLGICSNRSQQRSKGWILLKETSSLVMWRLRGQGKGNYKASILTIRRCSTWTRHFKLKLRRHHRLLLKLPGESQMDN